MKGVYRLLSLAVEPDRRHLIRGEPTLTLMILLLKLFSTTMMSSESAGESVPSWLQREDGEDKKKKKKLHYNRRFTTDV